jgi:hypothetical protein
MKSLSYIIFIVFSSMLILVNCTNPVSNNDKKTGSISISVVDKYSARTMKPTNTLIDVVSYTYSGSVPTGETIPETSQTSGTISATGLVPGVWTIIVKGKNSVETIVAEGSTQITVIANQTVSGSIQLYPKTGSGTFSLSVTWPSEVVVDSVLATITPLGSSTPENLTMPITGNSASYPSTSRTAGSYTLVVTLKNSGVAIAPPKMEAVRIYNEMPTNGVMGFSLGDFSSHGTVSAPTFSPVAGTYTSSQSVEISSSTAGASIRYTTDGTTEPTRTVGTLYASTITVDSSQTIKAIAYLDSWTDSSIASSAYIINTSGGAGLSILNPADIVVSLSGQTATLASNETMTVLATVSETVDSYAWYLDGVIIPDETTDTSIIDGSIVSEGPHTLTVFVQAGESLSSAIATFTVVPVVLYSIGDTGPAGGIVFYDKGVFSDGWRYLEAAPSDQSTGIRWDNGSFIPISTGLGIGSGKANTTAIVAAQGSGSYAASLCDELSLGGFDDWFLPSKDELNLMFVNLRTASLGGFTTTPLISWYWSSSQGSSMGYLYAWYQYFDDGRQYNHYLYDYGLIRAVRAF